MKKLFRFLSVFKKSYMSSENVNNAGSAAQLIDAVTGETVSKSELKRRMKEREKATKKAEKAEKAPAAPLAAKEEVLDPLKYFENRCAQVLKMENAYPHKVLQI
jgi:hypothetical protein